MAEAHPLPSTPSPALPLTTGEAGGGGAAVSAVLGRWRSALVLAFAVLALAVGAQGTQLLRLETARAADTEIIDIAGNQRALAQQVGRLSALIVAVPQERGRNAQALGLLLAQSRDEALALERLLARQRGPAAAGAGVAAALEAWQAARGRLWSRAGTLVRQAGGDAGPDLLPGALAVQAEVGPAQATAQRLTAALLGAAERRAASQRQALQWGTTALLGLVLLLGLAVIEPGVRAVRRAARRLQDRATEVQPPTLAAKRTSASVLVGDPAERVTAVGDACTPASGGPLAETTRATVVPTPLPGRAAVMERLERAIDHARRHPGYGFAVLSMDVGRQPPTADAPGPGAVDELLPQVAERLERALRPGDALAHHDDEARMAARLGGSEFVVVLEGVNDAQTVGVVAERLLEELAQPYLSGSTPVPAAASLGVVLYAGGESTADGILRNADTALYEARRAGRGRWVIFDDSMHERVSRTQAVEADLRRAFAEDELFVVYQPVMDLATRLPAGVEALVRWRHPARGLVPPLDFVGIAEEAGLVGDLDTRVLRAACLQFVRWQRELGAQAPRFLAVNLSRAQFRCSGLVADVRALLQETGLDPAQLQLEITDARAVLDDRVRATLRELRALGVKLALDDFGTGHSSLAGLHQWPVDTVKIDPSFVRRAETVETHHVLIEATIRVARALGMSTVAEGIETEGQAALMLRLECDRGQGFFYSRPLEAAEFAAWLRRETAAVALG